MPTLTPCWRGACMAAQRPLPPNIGVAGRAAHDVLHKAQELHQVTLNGSCALSRRRRRQRRRCAPPRPLLRLRLLLSADRIWGCAAGGSWVVGAGMGCRCCRCCCRRRSCRCCCRHGHWGANRSCKLAACVLWPKTSLSRMKAFWARHTCTPLVTRLPSATWMACRQVMTAVHSRQVPF